MSPVPRAVTWLIALLAPRDSRESLLADLEEEAAARAVRDGSRRARRWCWGQLAGSIGPLAGRRVAACVHLSGFVPRLFWRRLPHDAALSIRRLAQAPAFTAISGLTLAWPSAPWSWQAASPSRPSYPPSAPRPSTPSTPCAVTADPGCGGGASPRIFPGKGTFLFRQANKMSNAEC